MELFERPRVPTVITGLTDGWPAQQQWTEQALLERYGQHRFKVGIPHVTPKTCCIRHMPAIGSGMRGLCWLNQLSMLGLSRRTQVFQSQTLRVAVMQQLLQADAAMTHTGLRP